MRDPAYRIDPGLALERWRTFLAQVAEAHRIDTAPLPAGPPRELDDFCH